MLLLQAFGVGFALTLGVEVALGLCMAIKIVMGSNKK
jgi:hypothetical protein